MRNIWFPLNKYEKENRAMTDLILADLKTEISVGTITSNAADLLAAVKRGVEKYLDANYVPDEKTAKADRAELNRVEKEVAAQAKRICTAYNAPLEAFNNIVSEIRTTIKNAAQTVDNAVKAYEEGQKEAKRRDIQAYFDGKGFDLVPLDMFFDDRWLNKGYKLPDIKKEIDAKIAEIYGNIKVLENIADYGTMAKAFYLETLDMGAAMLKVQTLKDNAVRVAREQAEREQREHAAQIDQNLREQRAEEREAEKEERVHDLASEALDLPQEPAPESVAPKLHAVTLRFTGTKEKLEALKVWMSQNGISYEKVAV
jgi:predicted DNA binding CopG/RHH family protein